METSQQLLDLFALFRLCGCLCFAYLFVYQLFVFFFVVCLSVCLFGCCFCICVCVCVLIRPRFSSYLIPQVPQRPYFHNYINHHSTRKLSRPYIFANETISNSLYVNDSKHYHIRYTHLPPSVSVS